MKIIISLFVLIGLSIGASLVNATSGGTDANGCHNSKTAGWHCHTKKSTSTYTYDDYEEEEVREMTDDEIRQHLRDGKTCSKISNGEDKQACYTIRGEGDIFSEEEIREELKESRSCYKYYDFDSNNKACKSLLKNGIFTEDEIKSKSKNFSNCTTLRSYSADYESCKKLQTKYLPKTKKVVKTVKSNNVDSKTQKKIELINNKIELLHKKNPKVITRLHTQIGKILPKLKEGTTKYILISAINDKVEELLNEEKEEVSTDNITSYSGEGNTSIDSFSKAKKLLEDKVYNTSLLTRSTFYCGCDYSSDKYVNKESCGFQDNGKYVTRSKKIEWEHVVPAEAFGQSFKEWRDGHEDCVDSKGKDFKGRNCASKVNMEYRYMQSDMYNLVPAIGSINALRSNYSFAEISGEHREFGSCDMEISNRKAEPSDDIKGDVARIYMYMNAVYPNRGIIGNKNEKLFAVWNNNDPVSTEECNRYKYIKEVQGNDNPILSELCK